MTVTSLSLFDVEDSNAPKVRDMTVSSVGTKEVDEFCQRYHYTETGGSALWRYGLWHGPTLWGVVAYNLPTRESCGSVFGHEYGYDHVWHMGRLVLPDHALRNSESRLIAGSLRLIESQHPGVWAVLTYAAVDQGHIGYVYQATNAIYTGTGGRVAANSHYLDTKGRIRSSRNSSDGGYLSSDEAAQRGWTPVRTAAKHRYLYVLGNRRERKQRLALLRWPSLPYPKAA